MKEAEQGDKIDMKYCPTCEDSVLVKMKSGDVEIFKCEDCQFVVEDKE